MAMTWQEILDQIKAQNNSDGAASTVNLPGMAHAYDQNKPSQASQYAVDYEGGVDNPTTPTGIHYDNQTGGQYTQLTPDANGGIVSANHQMNSGNADLLKMVAAALTMGAGSMAFGAAAGAGGGAGTLAGDSLAAGGGLIGGGGGGIGAGGGLVGAGGGAGTLAGESLGAGGGLLEGAGALPYDASLDLPGGLDVGEGGLSSTGAQDLSQFAPHGLEADGVDQLANEVNKLTQQNTLAQNGYNFYPPDLPTIDLSNGLPKLPTDLLKKAASTLLKPGASGSTGQTSAQGQQGSGGVAYSQAQNETPGMFQIQAPQQQNQAASQAMQLGNPSAQPQVAANGYMPVTQGVPQNYQMIQLAKALQNQGDA